MLQLLARCFIKNHTETENVAVRHAYGVLCGMLGIALNLLLFAGKFFAGQISGSIAITADAFNNLSDSAASVITLIGFKLAGQRPDPEHPFGHGRIEYISGLIVSLAILLMGMELLKTSVIKIMQPEMVTFSPMALVILAVSIAVKFYMFLYNRSVGKRFHAPSITATAMDSLSDCTATAAVLGATAAGAFFSLPIDGYCGAVVACFILYAGFRAATETISPLLGQPPQPEFVQRIEKIVMASPNICGIHDLIVHDYGPGRVMITLHAEVPAHGDLLQLHDEIDNVEHTLAAELGCLATIHMDPIASDDALTVQTRERIVELVHTIDKQISIHDFRMVAGPTHTNVIFDAVVPHHFRLSDREVEEEIKKAVASLDGTYFAVVQIDKPFV